MLKYLFFIPLLVFSLLNTVSAYNTEGFENYSENVNTSTFECKKQCFVILGEKSKNDFIETSGILTGSGAFGYGFVNGTEIVPGEMFQIKENTDITSKFSFKNLQYYSQLPENIVVVMIFDGDIKSENFAVSLNKSSFGDKLKSYLNDFTKVEGITPYSINLRYGVNFDGTSIITIFYILFIIIFLVGIFFVKNKKDFFLYLAIYLTLFIGTRNLYSYIKITNDGLKNYTFQNAENKTFFDLGDYITFVDKVRKSLDLDKKGNKENCNIFIDSIYDWPFSAHLRGYYIRPCQETDISKANYLIYYKKAPENLSDYKIVFSYNNSYLLKK